MVIDENKAVHPEECDKVVDDRAGDTSQRCGNSPAFHFSAAFTDPANPPDILSNKELAARALRRGVTGDAKSVEFIIGKVGYRNLLKFCTAIEKRVSPEVVSASNAMVLIEFDKSMQAILLRGIGMLELQFRCAYARLVADELGAFAHRHPDNFKNEKHFEEFLDSYGRELGYKAAGDHRLAGMISRYGDLPVWEAVGIIPLGTLSKLYRDTRSSAVRYGVADSFGVKHEFLVSWLRTICEIRNRCAHFDDVCITPLKCRPKKIPGIKASNEFIPYACIVIERLIESGKTIIDDDVEGIHYSSFAEELIRIANSAPRPVMQAAGFPPEWPTLLSKASGLMEITQHIERVPRM